MKNPYMDEERYQAPLQALVEGLLTATSDHQALKFDMLALLEQNPVFIEASMLQRDLTHEEFQKIDAKGIRDLVDKQSVLALRVNQVTEALADYLTLTTVQDKYGEWLITEYEGHVKVLIALSKINMLDLAPSSTDFD